MERFWEDANFDRNKLPYVTGMELAEMPAWQAALFHADSVWVSHPHVDILLNAAHPQNKRTLASLFAKGLLAE